MGVGVSADSTYRNYSVVVPKFNGTAYTSGHIKDTGKDPVNLRVTTLGKALDARESGSDASRHGPWVRISRTNNYLLPSNVPKGFSSSVRFSNDLTTTVDVLVSGNFRTN